MQKKVTPILASYETCTGCRACENVCNTNSIVFKEFPDGHSYPIVEKKTCSGCNACSLKCPILKPSDHISVSSTPYAAWSKNVSLRMKSASGGAFAEFALYILEKGGVVIGAATRGVEVEHIAIERPEELYLLQGSKYTQSNTSGIYAKVREYLLNDRIVLFSGTSCQIAGLYKIISQKLTDKLYTVDLVCHGVPSKLLFSELQKQLGKEIKEIISYRTKEDGQKSRYEMKVLLADDTVMKKSLAEKNFYLSAFGNNKTMRKCCYECSYKNINRESDVTLGDFWGAIKFKGEHEKGISLVITHSKKGESLLFESKLEKHEVKWHECLKKNRNIFYAHNVWGKHPSRLWIRFFFKYMPIPVLGKLYDNCADKKNIVFFPLWLLDFLFTKKHLKNVRLATQKILEELGGK